MGYFQPQKELPSYLAASLLNAGIRQVQFEYDDNNRVVSLKAHILHGKASPKFMTGSLIEKGETR